MAFTYGFYNYDPNDDPVDQKLYDAEQVSNLFDGLITDGIYGHVGDCFMVTENSAGADNSVTVKSGRSWFNHTWNYNDAPVRIDVLNAPSAGYRRIDALVIKVDQNTRKNEITWHEGTAVTGTPSKPTLVRENGIYEYALAYVTRNAGVSVITSSYISNAVGTPETPYVTGILETLDTTQLISTFESEYSRWIVEKQAEFDEWFDHMKDQLTEDAAGQLQTEIDSIILQRNGTASTTSVSKQDLMINGASVGEISGSAYMMQTQQLSRIATTTYSFTHSSITSDSDLSVTTSIPNKNYQSISVSGNTCNIVYPINANDVEMTVKLHIRNN